LTGVPIFREYLAASRLCCGEGEKERTKRTEEVYIAKLYSSPLLKPKGGGGWILGGRGQRGRRARGAIN